MRRILAVDCARPARRFAPALGTCVVLVLAFASPASAQTPTPSPTPTATPTPALTPQPTVVGTTHTCDPSYPQVCIPPAPPSLNCEDVPFVNIATTGSDPHRFDADGNRVGCEGTAGTLGVSDATVTRGQVVRVTGSGYKVSGDPAEQRVRLFFLSHFRIVGEVSQTTGRFTASVTIPADAEEGVHQIAAKGRDPSGGLRALFVDVTVGSGVGTAGTTINGLPVTGRATKSSLVRALWALTAGQVLIAAELLTRGARRRRSVP